MAVSITKYTPTSIARAHALQRIHGHAKALADAAEEALKRARKASAPSSDLDYLEAMQATCAGICERLRGSPGYEVEDT